MPLRVTSSRWVGRTTTRSLSGVSASFVLVVLVIGRTLPMPDCDGGWNMRVECLCYHLSTLRRQSANPSSVRTCSELGDE